MGLSKERGHYMVKITNVATLMEAEQIVSLLRAYSIVAEKRETGSGSYMNIRAGISLSGYDIYVAEKDKERAMELIVEQEDEEPEAKSVETSSKRREIALRICSIIALLMVLFVFILSFYDL